MLWNIAFVFYYIFLNVFVFCQYPNMMDGYDNGQSEGPWTADEMDLFKMLTKYDKWDEFYERYNVYLDKLNGEKVIKNWEEVITDWMKWIKGIHEENTVKRTKKLQYFPENIPGRRWENPSYGMEMYWGDDEKPLPKKRKRFPSLKSMAPEQAKAIALQRLMKIQRQLEPQSAMLRQAVEKQRALRTKLGENMVPMIEKSSQGNPFQDLIPPPPMKAITAPPLQNTALILNVPTQKEPIAKPSSNKPMVAPQVDDFGSLIRWVNYNSQDTNDGLAKVTDKSTGKNLQFTFNGTVYVPIIDRNPLRYGLTTTTPSSPINRNESVLQTVLSNIDFKKASSGDWLAYSIINGETAYDPECGEDGCHARCSGVRCQSHCSGDTCTAGCVGETCNAACRGPGCMAMCIGASCEAKCDGMNCDSRCRGNNCDATCKKLSCLYTVNDVTRQTTATWNQLYPQYDTRHNSYYDEY